MDAKDLKKGEKEGQKIFFKNNLFIEKNGVDEKPRIIGVQCEKCKRYAFPAREICIFCYSRDVQKKFLNTRGKLHSYTICRVPVSTFDSPYAIGYIDLPEGLRIFAQLAEWSETELKIGMEMELVIEKLKVDKDGHEIFSYKFKPVR